MRAIIAGLMLVAAVPAAAADQFDLVCKGQRKWSPMGRPEPVEIRYRVDVAAKLWCLEKCSSVLPIAEITEAKITFERHEQKFAKDGSSWQTVDRVTGAWHNFDYEPVLRFFASAEGTCEPAEFSGFPAAKF